jgi:hypothetical protein
MNWYKIAQIWRKGPHQTSFDEAIKFLYKLEYQRHILINKPFSGVPQRKENILKNIEQEIWNTIEIIKDPLIKTFGKWLESHALTNASVWAKQRNDKTSEWGESSYDSFQSLLSEYERYKETEKTSYNQTFREIIENISENIEFYPSLDNFLDLLEDDNKNMLYEDLNSLGYREFGEQFNKKFKSEKQALDFIEKNNDTKGSFYNFAINYDEENFIDILSQNVNIDTFIEEIYSQQVFPLWFSYWQGQGIEETRENIQNIYNLLISNSPNIGDNLAIINSAINATHQTGNMIDYLEQYGNIELKTSTDNIIKLLDNLSNENSYIPKWNKELREIGVNTKGKQFVPQQMYVPQDKVAQVNKKYFFIGNCINGLEDDRFQSRVAYDATEMAQLVGSSIQINRQRYIQMSGEDIGINLYNCEFLYNQEQDILILYDLKTDIHYFFV